MSDGRSRVLFISYTADWRGPTRSLVHLLDHLDRDRYEVAVAHAGSGGFADALDERGIRRFPFDRLDKWAVPRLARIARGEGFDAVYANATHGSARNAFLAAKLARKPFVCHVRAMGWEKGWTRLGYLRFADAVIAVSEACADSVRRFVPDDRLHVVHNGVPVEAAGDGAGEPRGAGRGAAVREELGLPPEAVVALSVAHVCPRKGQLHLVEALERRDGGQPAVHLWLAGATDRDPGYVRRLRERVRRSGLDDRVRLLGFRDDVADLMRAADLFVHAAVEDPHPRAVLEAMASGLPVVAFGVDGVSETVESGVTGRLVDAGDVDGMAAALDSLARRPRRRSEWGAAGRRRVERRFSAERTAGEIDRILSSVVAGATDTVPTAALG